MRTPWFIETVAFDTPCRMAGKSLKMVANRYTVDLQAEGVIGVFTHAAGAHKESWEPTLERLFYRNGVRTCLREAWSLDWQDSGDSAVLNTEMLRTTDKGAMVDDFGEAIAEFLKLYLPGQRVVGIGHSGGCSGTMYSTKCFPDVASLPYEAIILVEPAFIDRETFQKNYDDRIRHTDQIVAGITRQQSQWESKVAAYEWLSKKSPWKFWDERVRRIFVEKGLRYVNSVGINGPVATKCAKRHEAAEFKDFEATFQAMEQIEAISDRVPIHVVFGAISDFVPRYSQDSTIDVKKGRKAASVARIPGAGHQVVHTHPDALAAYLGNLLEDIYKSKPLRSRL